MTKKPDYEVYTISQYGREGQRKSAWLRIGAAFKNRDDSINILLRALPLPDAGTGTALLHMRPPRSNTEAMRDDEAAFYLEIDPIMGAPVEEL